MKYIYIAVLAQSLSLLFGKTAALSAQGANRYFNYWYLMSLISLGIQALFWQQALRKIPLSEAYPMMSLVFIVILIMSYSIFREPISLLQLIGTAFIVIGTMKLAR
ncbi:EamA family transporter [Gemmatimonadota bacterium]